MVGEYGTGGCVAEDEPVDQITDLLRRVDNLYLDVPHIKFRG
jgi:hypothetical protein